MAFCGRESLGERTFQNGGDRWRLLAFTTHFRTLESFSFPEILTGKLKMVAGNSFLVFFFNVLFSFHNAFGRDMWR